MAIAPPLDKIPTIPVQIINLITPFVEQKLQQLLELILSSVEDAIGLPDRIDCNDPRVLALLDRLNQAQQIIDDIQKIVEFIQKYLPLLNTLIDTSVSLRTAILASSGPFAAVIVAAQLDRVAELTITNTIEAVKGLKDLTPVINISLNSLTNKLSEVASKLAPICGADVIPNSVSNNEGSSELQKIIDESNNLLTAGMSQYSGLLTSIEEAPSKVYNGDGNPNIAIGKPGDYFIDNTNKLIYGPKPTRTDWGEGVNF